MDKIDIKILEILSEEANVTATKISNIVSLSIPAVNKRIQKLQREGFIQKFTILTDAKKIGKPLVAFVFVTLETNAGMNDQELVQCFADDPDVLESYAITGEYDYLVKVCAQDVEDLDNKLSKWQRQEGVVKSHTMISLAEYKFQPTILP